MGRWWLAARTRPPAVVRPTLTGRRAERRSRLVRMRVRVRRVRAREVVVAGVVAILGVAIVLLYMVGWWVGVES